MARLVVTTIWTWKCPACGDVVKSRLRQNRMDSEGIEFLARNHQAQEHPVNVVPDYWVEEHPARKQVWALWMVG